MRHIPYRDSQPAGPIFVSCWWSGGRGEGERKGRGARREAGGGSGVTHVYLIDNLIVSDNTGIIGMWNSWDSLCARASVVIVFLYCSIRSIKVLIDY